MKETTDLGFPKTDFHQHFKTQRLLDAWYLLTGKNVAVLVDTVKPRIFKLFAFGRFGTLQQLLYDVDAFQESGRAGVRVVYYRGDTRYTTLKDKPYVFEDTPSRAIEFDPGRRSIGLRHIQCYGPDLMPDAEGVDFDASVRQNTVTFGYRVPPDADRAVVEIELYPLYTDYRAPGWRKDELLDYNCWDSRLFNPAGLFSETVSGRIQLRDRHGRVPALDIACPGARINLTAFCDEKRNDVHRLRLTIEGRLQEKVALRLRENPVTIDTSPIIPAETPHRIVIRCKVRPRVHVAGRTFPVRHTAPRQWSCTIRAPHGVSRLLAESGDGVSDRQIAAVADIPGWIEKMGRAAAACLWDSGPVKDLMPQFIDVKRLTGKVRGPHGRSQKSAAYYSHNPRALMIIAAAARQTGDRALLDRAWASIQAMVRLAYRHENGALVLPIIVYPDGSPGCADGVRPSDPAIAIRSILMVRSVYEHWGQTERAEEALEYAKGFARALLMMAGPDGRLEARYRYPTLELTQKAQIPGRGTVNNWVTNIWCLAEILRRRQDPLGNSLRELCINHADLLVTSRPSILRVAGGGEDGPNNSDALNAAAGFFLIKYLATGAAIWARRAKDAFLMAALNNTIVHIDQPQNFFFTFDWTESAWHDGPMNVMSKGGMHDLTSCDVGLALAHYTGDAFARDMCTFQFLTRLVDGVFDNGAVLNRVTAMPNFHYVKTDFTETLNFGAVGVYAFYQTAASEAS